MEDVQDGIKVSVQDGVTEDPNIPQEFEGGSGTAKTYLSTPITTPEIKSEVRGEIGVITVATISCSVAGVVT